VDNLRPVTWEDYIGQEKLKERLQIHINGALDRAEPLDHILLCGPPGCGKTTIASLIADSIGLDFLSFVMPIKKSVLVKIVQSYTGIVLFDELHRLKVKEQEELLPLIEDDYLQLDNGGKVHAGVLTVIGATTERDQIIPPLFDRYPIKPSFDEYTDQEMGRIILGMAAKLGMSFDDETAIILGRASGGIPRNAKSLVKMARDLDSTDPHEILSKSRLTPDGLTEHHLEYVRTLMECGGTAGIEILAAHLRLPKMTIVDLERLLLKRGMIEYTKQGRSLLGPAYKAIGQKIQF
jgi:Holliday junction DNA helicase RuvB